MKNSHLKPQHSQTWCFSLSPTMLHRTQEAECLARVRRLGKPILGICNVKAALNDEDDVRLFLAQELVSPRSQTAWGDCKTVSRVCKRI